MYMSKKIISENQKRLNEVKVLYQNQKNKKFNYNLEDFIIVVGDIEGECKWKHKSWKTWVKGYIGYDSIGKTRKMIATYILECEKPYGKRNLDFIHLT